MPDLRPEPVDRERDMLRQALRGALKLPRPWIDGGVTFEEWEAAFAAIDAALAAGRL